jgi:prepilin-type N-terminal cleavage/methylation domain-containing protein
LARGGWSLTEVMVVLTMIGVLLAISAPSFHRSVEQSRADVAAANLRAIWSAQRVYWLEYRTYAASLSVLESLDLVDPAVVSATTTYVYAIQSADDSTFSASATRTGSARWSGAFTVDHSGVISGAITASGELDITAGFQ